MKKRAILVVFIALLALCASAVFKNAFADGPGEGFQRIFRDFALPKALSIRGELMRSDEQRALESSIAT
jgi:hypothetical protein